jgi:hypothetical protein
MSKNALKMSIDPEGLDNTLAQNVPKLKMPTGPECLENVHGLQNQNAPKWFENAQWSRNLQNAL